MICPLVRWLRFLRKLYLNSFSSQLVQFLSRIYLHLDYLICGSLHLTDNLFLFQLIEL